MQTDPMLEFNQIMAQKISESESCVQHVNAQMFRGELVGYSVSDWYDETTVCSYENGVEL